MNEVVIKKPKKQKIGGSSKKGRQNMVNKSTGKYVRQAKRTEKHKQVAWKKHLEKHPNDITNQKILKEKLK